MHSLFFPNTLLPTSSLRHNTHSDADIFENEQAFWMELPVAGFEKDDFTISASEHQVVLKASRDRQLPEGFSQIQEGAVSTEWERTFRFKRPLKADGIEAVVANGVLTLTLPKKTKEHLVVVQAR